MAAGSTYTPIATTTLGSAQSSVTFSSFSGYTDLILVTDVSLSVGSESYLRFNSDSGTNYSMTVLLGTGTSAISSRSTNSTFIGFHYNSAGTGQRIMETFQIQNYSNTTTNKTVLGRLNNTAKDVVAGVGLWRNTAAITSLTFSRSAGNFETGSTFTLYGIQAA